MKARPELEPGHRAGSCLRVRTGLQLDLDGLAGEEAPLALLFEPDGEDGKVGIAGFAAVVVGGGERMADPVGVADDFNGLIGKIDGNEVGGFIEEGFFEGGFVLDVAVGMTVGEFIDDESIEGGFIGVDEGLAEGFNSGSHCLLVLGLGKDRGRDNREEQRGG